MAKSKTSATVLTCDICGFKVANPYIFKRHLHKCFTLHGIASKRSTPRHPIRLKGTEGLKSSDNKLQDESFEGASESSSKEGMDPLPLMPGSFGFGDEEEGSIASSVSSHWGVTNSPQVPVDTTLDKKEEMAMTSSEVETPSPTLPARAKFERKYRCETCPFETLKSRSYLYHLRDEHAEKLNIFECHLCDYASRYNNKLARHMSVHKKPGGTAFSPDPAILSTQRLRVKPLKLKRLSVRTSSEFEVSPTTSPKLSRTSPSASSIASPPSTSKIALNESIKTEKEEQVPKPNKQRDVFKMVLAEDGSHHYQCRSCLFYANSPHSVKKHHVLCHSKVLNCSYCEYYTTEQAEYYEHLLTHGGTGKLSFLKCEDCSYVTNARSNYEKHRSFHGADSPFHCTVCNFAAESESKVKRHMATQHTNTCSDAQDEVSLHAEQMAMGMVDESSMNIQREPVLNEDQSFSSVLDMEGPKDFQDQLHIKYRCPQCPIVCLRRGNFTRHLIARHNFTQASASQTSKSMERKMLRKRKLPGKMQISQSISVKKRRQLVYSGENLKCSECSYTAKWPSDLRRHRLVHTIVKRFKCSMCNNKYKYAGDLNVHMRRDHLTEPHSIMAKDFVSSEVVKKASPALFRCPICPFSTHSKANLEQHSKQHKDIEKTFRCRLCKYQTYWRGDVGRHLFRHHGILMGKDPQEIDNYFIHRPEIRPLTKQPQYNNVALKSPQMMNVESESGMSMDSHDVNGAENSNSNEPVFEKYPPLLTVKEGQMVCSYVGCDYRTSTPDRFEAHLAYHENLKQYVCPTCGKRTNWKWDIVKHMHKVHQDSTATNDHVVTLSLEEARATIADYMLKRERKASGIVVYLCSLCDFKSGDKSHVVNHLAINHKEENGRVLNKYLPKSYRNSNLTSGSAQAESADSVSLNETRKPDLFVDPSPEELAKMDKPFACALCQKAEISKAEVRKHYSYAHPYKDVRVIYTADGTEFDFNTNEIYSRKSDLLQETEENSDSSNLKIVRHDSKYSNPKMHGYVKPFKCSICGVRSNWKWDLKKHLRAKHPNEGGFVIMLSIAEAKSTYALECSPSHPKEANRQPVYKLPSEQKPSPNLSPFKHPYRVKGEPYDANYGIFGSLKSTVSERVTNFDPRRRQWKCSGCSYISNWRRNMARHIQRHHGFEKNKIRIIALHLLNKDSQQRYLTGQGSQNIPANDTATSDGPMRSGSSSNGSCKLWSCSKCSFQSNLRTHIIIHMQKHGMKPFLCGVCNIPFMNRGPLHRHIQKTHRRSDYIKLCKVNIDFGDIDTRENVFICCICQFESKDKSTTISHIEKEHEMKDYEYYIVTMQRKSHQNHSSQDNGEASPDKQIRSRRIHHCQLCPYRSQKKSMLVFHMTYHKPTPANRFKCKYCPYYVSTSRLLHQHQRKWHTDNNRHIEGGARVTGWEQMQSTPPVSPLKQDGQAEQSTTCRRHFCEKCPYSTNSKNDFLYHKQFHRPKRTAEYKCEYCDYWVVHKRLLKQHMRLHTKKASHEPEVSPVKSVYSDPGLVYDPVELSELAAIKQQMISAKITPSLSKSPKFSPMKMATKLSVDDKPGYVLKNGLYRKLHKCKRCPYTNTRARNMQLHEMMHGPRQCSYPLMKCPYCDYYVGSKGLLSHHMKVHLKNYGDTPENDAAMACLGTTDDDDGSDTEIQTQQKVDTLLSISRFKRFGCEKCPYASAKRQHFERHLELHGSRQRYTCQYCDYSVPSSYLLTQHSKLHLMPNQNLLASQSITNLQYMSEVPADVALASALPPTDRDMPVTISVIHDHLGLYENSIYDSEPKKLYRCDRCPYANVRRDYLLSHLKFHMVPSSLVCPYCDYSAPKQALLIQHIRVHFCPLPELSDWLLENGQTERETSQRNIDLAEALKVAHEYQNQSKKKSKGGKLEAAHNTGKDENTEEKENVEEGQGVTSSQTLICQYCDREFSSSEKLVKHELQHLIGNQFEMALKSVSEDQQQNASSKQSPKPDSNGEAAEMKEDSKEPVNDGLQSTSVNESMSEENGGGSPVMLEITGDDSLKLELSMDTNFSEDQDLSAMESPKDKEHAPDVETGNDIAEVELKDIVDKEKGSEMEKDEVDKDKDNEMEKPMEECSDAFENTHTMNEEGDGNTETIADKELPESKHDAEDVKDSCDNKETSRGTENETGKDSKVLHNSTSDSTSLVKKTMGQEGEKDDIEQNITVVKSEAKSEEKFDAKEEVTDVIGEIEKLLGDVDVPEAEDTIAEEGFKTVLSSTPSKGNMNDLKEAQEGKPTHSEETKDPNKSENKDKVIDRQDGSEETMETSDIDDQNQVEQDKMDHGGKTTDLMSCGDATKELELKDTQSEEKMEVEGGGSGDVMEEKTGKEIVELEGKNSVETKKKDDDCEKVTDDTMDKECFTKLQELTSEEVNNDDVKKESAEEGLEVNKVKEQSAVPEKVEEGSGL